MPRCPSSVTDKNCDTMAAHRRRRGMHADAQQRRQNDSSCPSENRLQALCRAVAAEMWAPALRRQPPARRRGRPSASVEQARPAQRPPRGDAEMRKRQRHMSPACGTPSAQPAAIDPREVTMMDEPPPRYSSDSTVAKHGSRHDAFFFPSVAFIYRGAEARTLPELPAVPPARRAERMFSSSSAAESPKPDPRAV